MNTVLDSIEAAQQGIFYATVGTALAIGVCWTIGSVVVSKSIDLVLRKRS